MKSYRIVAMTLVSMATVALTACAGPGNEAPARPAKAAQTSSPTASVSTAPTRNTHNNLQKKVGEPAWLVDESGKDLVKLTVDAIEVDPGFAKECSEVPLNGHYVSLAMSVETFPELANDPSGLGWINFHPTMFSAFTDTGQNVNDSMGNGFSCLTDADRFSDHIGPGQAAKGTVVLDLPTIHGSIAYSTEGEGFPGWEWSY